MDYGKYKLIFIYGDSDEIFRIINLIRSFFFQSPFQKFELKDDISQNLISNSMFFEKELFLVENINQTFLKNKKLFENLRVSENLLIVTSGEYHAIDFEKDFFLEIEAKRQSASDRNAYIEFLIKKNNLSLTPKHLTIIKYLLSGENFLTIESEINKLRLLMKNHEFQLTDEKIYNLFNFPAKNIINDLIESIVFGKKDAFEILYKIIDKYDSILIIRSIYNYYLKLQNLLTSIAFEKKSFDIALSGQYGLLIGNDKNLIKNKLKTFNINKINEILQQIIHCEIGLKENSDRSVVIFEELLLKIIF